MISYRTHRAKLSIVLLSSLLFQPLIPFVPAQVVYAAESSPTVDVLKDQTIVKGVQYQEKQYYDYVQYDNKYYNEKAFIITADLNDPTVNIISSKAKDKAVKLETVSQQIQRETFKGHNVVAGINADMFNTATGLALGLQVKDGHILTGFDSKAGERRFSIFGVDRNKKAFVDFVSVDAKLSVVDSVYESVYGKPNPDPRFTTDLDSINRNESMAGKMNLQTPMLSDSRVVTYPNGQEANAAFTVLKGVSGPVKLGQVYEAEVESIQPTSSSFKSITVPEDRMVIASQGAKADWVKQRLKQGDKVRFSFNINDTQGNRLDLVEAVAGYATLVQDGKAKTEDELIAQSGDRAFIRAHDKARTAIGVTEDNKVVAMVVDGGDKSLGISHGLSVTDMAKMMADAGVKSALSLDGGGSTQMNARLYGETAVGVVNRPSDGSERAVTNALLFTSTAERSFQLGSLSLGDDVRVYKDTEYTFSLKGTDKNNNPIDVSNAQTSWKTVGDIGTIGPNGQFRARSAAAQGSVEATIGRITGKAAVTVLDSVYSISLTDKQSGNSKVTIDTNANRPFRLTAQTEDGKPILIDNKSAEWSILPERLGSFDRNGVLTTTAEKGEGIIIVKLNDKEVQLAAIIGQEAKVIDDFEQSDSHLYKINGYVGGVGEVSTEQAKSGTHSYKITYDYSKWTRQLNGTINFQANVISSTGAAQPDSKYQTTLQPLRLGMWVYGDGQAPWMRAIIVDGKNQKRTLELASSVYWKGWKYVDAVIPADVPTPISLNYIYMVETNKSKPNLKGSVYFDDIRFAYSDNEDLKGPAIETVSPSSSTVYNPDIDFQAKISDDKSGVNPGSVALKLDGAPIAIDGTSAGASFDPNTGMLTYKATGLSEGAHTFTVDAADQAGNQAVPPLTATFTVNLQPDTLAPVISGLLPMDGTAIKTPWPKISAKIKDVQSGVHEKDIVMAINGQPYVPYYDEASGWAYIITDQPLTEGSYTVTVTAKDRAGNAAEQATATFLVEPPIQQPKNADQFVFSVSSDSHATPFGDSVFERINNDLSELVIQNGDLVDNDTTDQWDIGRRHINNVLKKQYMITPGNHEAFKGSLTSYMTHFGTPTYSFTYGNSLFISLNSALGQSLSAPDPTQFHYLQRLLDHNDKPNVFIYTHNTTRDSFGTAHEMLLSDAERLEKMLGDYKKANPSKNVNVIFGHLHVSQSWEKDGVMYTISGDEALKKYVTPQEGGFLSYTQFYVNGSQVSHKFFPLVEKLAVQDPAIQQDGTLKMVKGAIRMMNVYGDFTEYTADYLINLSKFKDVDMTWTSKDDTIASVTANGLLTANQVGKTQLTVTVSGVQKTLNLEVVDSGSVTPIKISISPESEDLSGNDKFTFNVTGLDVFGNSFAVDNSLVSWSSTNQIGTVDQGTLTAAVNTQEDKIGQVVAEYKGFTAAATVKVRKTTDNSEDRTPPAVPTGLQAIPGDKSVTLLWDANQESDLAGYVLYNGSDDMVYVDKQLTSYTFQLLENGQEYHFAITAKDSSGNQSAQSERVTAVPQEQQSEDTTAPSWTDKAIKATDITTNSAHLKWSKAVDNVGVAGYRIYSGDRLIGSVAGDRDSYSVTGLQTDTTYTFKVIAGDAANNWSLDGPSVTIRTLYGSTTTSSSPVVAPGPSGPAPTSRVTQNADGSVALTKQAIQVTKETTSNGSVVTRAAIDEKSLAEAFSKVKGTSSEQVIISVGADAYTIFQLPASVLIQAQTEVPGVTLLLRTGSAEYQLSLGNGVDLAKLAKEMNTDGKNSSLQVLIASDDKPDKDRVSASVKAEGGSLFGDVYRFTVQLVADGKTKVIPSAATKATRLFDVPAGINPSKMTVVKVDPVTGAVQFVPSIFKQAGGKTQAVSYSSDNGIFAVMQLTRAFPDMTGHWSETDVHMLASKLVVDGMTDTSFAPDAHISRAQFTALIVRALGLNATGGVSSSFADMASNDWSLPYVSSAVDAGIIDGFEDGTFKPDATITREQMAVIVSKALGVARKSVKQGSSVTQFADGQTISPWANAAVNEVVRAGIINGMTDETFGPQQTGTRAQAAVMLARMMRYIGYIN